MSRKLLLRSHLWERVRATEMLKTQSKKFKDTSGQLKHKFKQGITQSSVKHIPYSRGLLHTSQEPYTVTRSGLTARRLDRELKASCSASI